jgi:general secretion pathway protein F
MAVFEYKGILVGTGKAVQGLRDAENVKALRAQLRKDGVLLTTAAEEKAAQEKQKGSIDLKRLFDRPSVSDVAIMTRQLATLVKAQIPLFEALSALIEQTEKEGLKRALTNVRDSVREGTAFADALKEHPKIFPELYVNMVRAGESSGTLDGVLMRLTHFMEGQSKLRGKVTSALAYPVLMMGIAIIMISVLMTSVVPKVVSMFQNMNKALPWYTRGLITVSEIASGYWWLVLLLVAAGSWWFRRWRKTPEGRVQFDRLMLKAPLFGQLTMMVAISRFSRTLATLLSAGVALLPAMGIVKNVLGNGALEKIVEEATGSIREGQSIADPLKQSGYFPPLVTHMIAIGEKSGQLEEMLENVAEAYDTAVDARVQLLTSLLEPIIIVVMGGAVAFIAFAILMPLIQMSDFVG